MGYRQGSFAGAHVAGAGDVNGDGYADLLIGAHGDSAGGSDAGAVYLILGGSSLSPRSLSAADAELTGESDRDYAGVSVASAGDFDADGYDDILIGSRFSSGDTSKGAAYVILGGSSLSSLPLSSADVKISGEEGDYAGESVSGAGDFNGDGYDDLLVSASGVEEGGVCLLLGRSSPSSMPLSSADVTFTREIYEDAGVSVSRAGDMDSDGFDDVLLGASGDFGGAFLVFGSPSPASDGAASAHVQFTGENAWDYAGTYLAGGGDLNGDGYLDILVGALGYDNGGSSSADYGALYVLYGLGL